MKYIFLALLLPISMISNRWEDDGGKYKSTLDLLTGMKIKAEVSDLRQYTFTQTTTRYTKEGAVDKVETWYEAVQYPDRLRIDFGDLANQNAALYRGDQLYFFKAGELKGTRPEKMEFLFLEGGLKERSLVAIIDEMMVSGYKTQIFRKDKFQERKVFVIGAEKGDLKSKQIWIDQERLVQVRRIDPMDEERLLEVQFKTYQNVKGHWIPKEIEFFMNGKAMQTEVYHDVVLNPDLKEELFDPEHFFEWHWNGK